MASLRTNIIRALGGDEKSNVSSAKPEALNTRVSPVNTPTGFNRPKLDASANKLFEKTTLTPQQQYAGLVYRAITTISNRTAQVLINNTVLKDSKDEEIELSKHPYWSVMQESPSFTTTEFFTAIATYLQLCGFAPVLAVRSFRMGAGGAVTSVGEVKEFKILSPYNIQLMLDDNTDELLGYEEIIKMHSGQLKTRELAPPHVIPAKIFNPFDNLLGYGVAMAANDYQYTHLEASKYTRRSMRNNISTSGILTVNKLLDTTQRENFKSELKARYASDAADGSPIVAFGSDALGWQDLRQDMDKMALEKIHDLNTEDLLTVMGVSKTVMGIEQSGVTRETSKVQQDLLMMNVVMPLATAILDSFNQDYRNNYPNQWATNKYNLELDSPVSKDYEAGKLEAETLNVKLDVAKKMWQMGASRDSIMIALELPEEIEFEDVPRFSGGQGENPLDQLTDAGLSATPPAETPEEQQNNAPKVGVEPTAQNALTFEQVTRIKQLRENLLSDIQAHEMSYVDSYISAISEEMTKNSLLPDDQQQKYINELAIMLVEYYMQVVPVIGSAMLDYRVRQYGLPAMQFDLTEEIINMIRTRVEKTALSHFDTVDNALSRVLEEAVDNSWSRERMVREVRNKFTNEITQADARRLAVTETNNAFNKSQYWADQDFIARNNLEGRAYKTWVTYSNNACPHCVALSQSEPIPFNDPFVAVGQSFGAEFEHKDGTKVVRYITPNADFGAIEDGNAHPNCQCKYRLILRSN